MQDHQIDIQLVHNTEWHWGGGHQAAVIGTC